MSYSFSFRDRDRPRLSDRLRGKSGDELFNELRKELDQDRKSFFKNPSATPASNFGSSTGSTFPRVSYDKVFHHLAYCMDCYLPFK